MVLPFTLKSALLWVTNFMAVVADASSALSIFSQSYHFSVHHQISRFQPLHFFHLELPLASGLANGPEVLGS